MSDYRRFISYIYAYERDIKSKNVGFAKVEVRNGECRIAISIKGAFAASDKDLEAYLFYREEEKLPGVHIGTFGINNGAGELHCVLDAGNICGSGVALESMCGIILRHKLEDTRMYASGWDDIPILPWRMEEKTASSEKERISGIEVLSAEEIPVIAAVEEELKRLELPAEEEITEDAWCGSADEAEDPWREVADEAEDPWREVAAVEEECQTGQSVHRDLWERLEDTFPKIIAFEDDPGLECLKIDLKDLENLPKENWGLANNSFLLHGYYNFRYLILGKVKENEYMLGVPGMFHNNERFLAAMFGFEYFKAVKEYKPLTGHFGYWYRRVVL